MIKKIEAGAAAEQITKKSSMVFAEFSTPICASRLRARGSLGDFFDVSYVHMHQDPMNRPLAPSLSGPKPALPASGTIRDPQKASSHAPGNPLAVRRYPTMATPLLAAVLAMSCLEPTDHSPLRDSLGARPTSTPEQATMLTPIADTYLRSGSPNQNQGTELFLRLQSSGHNRALIQFDSQALVNAVGSGTLQSARLELAITLNADNWGTSGRTIDLHRMTQAWTELGATWNCAIDANPANQSADCSGATAWTMGSAGPNPWVATPTATATITNGQTGVVTLDVTPDVTAMLAGGSGGAVQGWILKKTEEGQAGHVEFGSRESSSPPRMVIVTTPLATNWPLLVNALPALDTTKVVALSQGPNPTYLYRTEFGLHFQEEVTDSAKAAFFARNSIVVLGVTQGGTFFVRIPDPGPTLQAYYAAMDALRAQPEVKGVGIQFRTPLPQIDLTRFPNDGVNLARANWLTNSTSTWAFRAIRAPLAWGCETGKYGDRVPKIGLFEWKHQPAHPELVTSSPQLRQPSDSQLGAYSPVSPASVIEKETHAAATTGLLSAEGDNGQGIAGVMWRSRLYLYSGYSAGNRPLPLASGFHLVADTIITDSLDVLNFSADARLDTLPPDRTEEVINYFADFLRLNLFDRLPSLMVVVAAGNDGFRGSVTDYVRTPGARIVLGGLLLLAQNPTYRSRIIVVGGTQAGGYLWNDGNFITGAVDIAAPARDVTLLDRWPGGSAVPTTINSGTSLAAPMVAGVAGLLRSMDSTLTPAQVKEYILRGAQVKRIDPATGDSVAPPSVSGAPETTYQLDTYGPLVLLSQERPGTPVCGFPVAVRGFDLVLERPAGIESYYVPGTGGLFAPSMAQGGRLFAVSDDQGLVHVLDHHGVIQQSLSTPVIERRFLERDTVDVLYSLAPQGGFRPLFRFRPSRQGIPTPYNPWVIAVPAAPDEVFADGFSQEFSPTGDSVVLQTHSPTGTFSPDGSPITRIGWDQVNVSAGTSTSVREWFLVENGQYCTGDCVVFDHTSARWSHGGNRLALMFPREERAANDTGGIPFAPALRAAQGGANAFGDITAYRTGVVMLSPSGTTETTIEGLRLVAPRFLPDDSVMTFREQSLAEVNVPGPCQATMRLGSDLTLWRKATDVGPEECDQFGGWFSLPDLLNTRSSKPIPSGPSTEASQNRSRNRALDQKAITTYLRHRPVWIRGN